jgi:hypothetical protein
VNYQREKLAGSEVYVPFDLTSLGEFDGTPREVGGDTLNHMNRAFVNQDWKVISYILVLDKLSVKNMTFHARWAEPQQKISVNNVF